MLTLISMSGPFGILATALGVTAAGMQLVAIVRPQRRRLSYAAVALAASALLLGIAGTGIGLMVASDAIIQAAPEIRADLWMRGRSVAETSTTVGAIWASLNGVLYAVAATRSSSRS